MGKSYITTWYRPPSEILGLDITETQSYLLVAREDLLHMSVRALLLQLDLFQQSGGNTASSDVKQDKFH